MASIGIGIGIEDLILQVLVLVLNFGNCQVLVLVLVLTLGSSEVLVLVSEKWYCLSLICSALHKCKARVMFVGNFCISYCKMTVGRQGHCIPNASKHCF